jgi:hypothetical protein
MCQTGRNSCVPVTNPVALNLPALLESICFILKENNLAAFHFWIQSFDILSAKQNTVI